MQKAKRKSSKLIAFLFLIITVIISYFLYKIFFKNKTQSKLIVSPTPTIQQDTDNDGKYTDYRYKFEFSYPKDIFVYQNPTSNGPEWVNEQPVNNDKYLKIYKSTSLVLSVQIKDKTFEEKFDELYSLETNKKTDWGATKQDSKESGDYKMVKFYFLSDTGEYYGSWWLRASYPVVSIELSSGSSQTLEKNKEILDQISESFKYF